jgi:serine/threonine-protein kinase
MPATQGDESVSRRAHDSVARAVLRASQVPLTHFAAGRLAVSDGRFGDAARELTLALAMAPTYAAVHAYLGSLQCEAGRSDMGERHIQLATRLEPSLSIGSMIGRSFALNRELDRFRESVDKARARGTESRFILESIEMRVAGWFGDLETVRRCRPYSFLPQGQPIAVFSETQRRALLGEATEAELVASVDRALAGSGPRLETLLRQLVIEALVPMGAIEAALAQLRRLTEMPPFVDADWLERCPALDPLRSHHDFVASVTRVRSRADAIWRMASST